VYNQSMDLIRVVYNQLPRGIADKLTLDVKTDAYLMNPKLIVKDASGREFHTHLEADVFEGVEMRTKVPEVFIAHLCAVV
jgi:hypothetical protein